MYLDAQQNLTYTQKHDLAKSIRDIVPSFFGDKRNQEQRDTGILILDMAKEMYRLCESMSAEYDKITTRLHLWRVQMTQASYPSELSVHVLRTVHNHIVPKLVYTLPSNSENVVSYHIDTISAKADAHRNIFDSMWMLTPLTILDEE